jgi:beta-lactamase regulating signal transducer with metallopeptidase domain
MMAAALLQLLDLQSVAQLSSERMLNCATEGIGIALLAWMLLRGLGRQNSGTRFAVWFSALLGIAALPLFGPFASNGAEVVKRSEITMPASWALYLFTGWLLMAAAGLVRIGVGFWRLRQLRKSCVRIDAAALDPLLRKALEEFDSPRSVAVCVSERLRVPTAIGFMRPLVVIPSWAMEELSAVELNAILLHELAHLRRWDDWTNLIQKVLGALLFFHPAVWWIEKKLALEREMACDDLVLAETASPRAYAECLVSLAEKSLLRRGFALAQAAVGRMRHISLRVAQILDEKRPGATRVWRPAPFLLTGISIACLMVFSDAPRLVSFENGAAASMARSATMIAPGSGELAPISPIGSHVVPAIFVLKPAAKSSVSAAANAKTSKPAVVLAKATPRRVMAPMLIRSSAAEEAITPQTLIFVMQTRHYEASGSVVWDLCVWQVTVIGPRQNRMEQEFLAKSI